MRKHISLILAGLLIAMLAIFPAPQVTAGAIVQPNEKPVPCGQTGDVDGDGSVGIDDATLIMQYITHYITLTTEQMVRAEVNNDGKVNIWDAMFIGNYVNGYRDSLPKCPNNKVPPCGNYGDVWPDGTVSLYDALVINYYTVGLTTLTTYQKSVADVTGDGAITVNDAMFIAQYINGSRATFPVCSLP